MLLAPHKAATRPHRQLHPVRLAIVLTLLAAHVLGVLYFASLRTPVPDSSDYGFATTVFFLENSAQPHATRVTKLPPRSSFAPPRTDRLPQRPSPPETPAQSARESTAPVAIDWAKEAERVAADPGLIVGAEPAPAAARQQFGWDYAHTHRVEPLPDGGLMVNLSDRCSIIVRFPMLLGGCKLGRLESRADLFAHMHEQSSTPP
jgi:hypothetical protein